MKKLLLFLLIIPSLIFGQMKVTDCNYLSTYKYRVYEPTNFKPKGVILYFAGTGERGSDLNILERNEIPKLFKSGVEKPFIVICPQLDLAKTAWGTAEIYSMLNILDAYARFYGIDKHVTGLSLGGMGTYAAVILAYTYNGNKPGYFKTAAPVCGRTSTTNIEVFKNMSIKIYHGLKDSQVPVSPDQTLFKLLTDNHLDVEAKFYEGWDHPIWGMAYDESLDGYWRYLETKTGPTIPITPTSTADTVRIFISSPGPYIVKQLPQN